MMKGIGAIPGVALGVLGLFLLAGCGADLEPGEQRGGVRSAMGNDDVCPDGQEPDALGGCQDCVAGSFSAGGAACEPCAQGSYSDIAASSCVECGDGLSTAGPGATALDCAPCAAGEASNAATGYLCQACTPGQYSNAGDPACTDCSPGYFSDTPGSASCAPCADNFTTPGPGSTSAACEACPAGLVSYEWTGHTCMALACTPGQSGNPATGVCTDCPQGTYADDPAALTCTPCGDDMSTPAAGSTSAACVACAPGEVSNAGTGYLCVGGGVACPPGQSPDAGGICVNCPRGTFKDTADGAACTPCGDDKSTVGAGSTSARCYACPAGEISNATTDHLCVITAIPPPFFDGIIKDPGAGGAIRVDYGGWSVSSITRTMVTGTKGTDYIEISWTQPPVVGRDLNVRFNVKIGAGYWFTTSFPSSTVEYWDPITRILQARASGYILPVIFEPGISTVFARFAIVLP